MLAININFCLFFNYVATANNPSHYQWLVCFYQSLFLRSISGSHDCQDNPQLSMMIQDKQTASLPDNWVL